MCMFKLNIVSFFEISLTSALWNMTFYLVQMHLVSSASHWRAQQNSCYGNREMIINFSRKTKKKPKKRVHADNAIIRFCFFHHLIDSSTLSEITQVWFSFEFASYRFILEGKITLMSITKNKSSITSCDTSNSAYFCDCTVYTVKQWQKGYK